MWRQEAVQMNRIKVLIVDDSAVVRQVMGGLLSKDPEIEIIATAADPLFARQKMARLWPDVIVLDVEMPRMDGITFLKQIMAEHPTPTLICSTLTEKGAQTTMAALDAGAVDVIAKPKVALAEFLDESAAMLIRSVKAAAAARLDRRSPTNHATPIARKPALGRTTDQVVAIGTSTGGTQALEQVLRALPGDCPGIVVVQHMPEKFTAAFAERLNQLCDCEVKEAENNDRVRQGLALIAPGGFHMRLVRSGAQYRVLVTDGPPVNRHKPSVDVLFRSTAAVAGANAKGIIMTGMGADGARGLLEMRQAGAQTIAQDEASCVVYGMPKEAVKLGAAEMILPLHRIPEYIMTLTPPWAEPRHFDHPA